jgi:hypothetical protein
MSPTRCFLDLDGVLVDLIAGAARRHGLPVPAPWPAGVFYIYQVLDIEPAAFWAPLDEDFWADLDPTPDCHALGALAERLFGFENVCILSSPPLHPGSLAGKYRWILKHLPTYARQYLIGPAKHFAASPATVLLDDADHNVARFTEAGGHGLLVPRAWNSGHGLPPADVLTHLERKLRALLHGESRPETRVNEKPAPDLTARGVAT